MENYIVRIYRRDSIDPDKVAGVFESVENETSSAFTSLSNIVELLSPKCGDRTCGDEPGNHQPVQLPEPATLSD